jgi:hypothetical protein
MLYVHKEDCRISYIFLTHAHPVEQQSIHDVDISINNISDIVMSRNRIPEINMSTAMLKVVNTPECYQDKKEHIKKESTVPVNRNSKARYNYFRSGSRHVLFPVSVDVERSRRRAH